MRKLCILILGFFCFQAAAISPANGATTNSFQQTNLVSDTSGMASIIDSDLVNPRGVAFLAGNPFWIADRNSGLSTIYSKTGKIQSSPFTIPPPVGSSNPATPAGIVANGAGGFNINGQSSQFIFATEDGTISGWHGGGSSASLAVDNSKTGAVYKGLALISNSSGTFLLATNFNSGNIDTFDSSFHSATLPGTFQDPNLPAGYAPFGIHLINNQLVVTFALQDAAKHDPVHQAGAGFVDLFDLNGNLIRRIASQSNLNAPWGAAIAPAGFGSFGGDLLIGNFGDGTISAFDFTAGIFVDQMKDANGAVMTNPSLGELVFDPSGRTGDPNALFITAGLANGQHGLFASLAANTSIPAVAPDFTISAMPSTLTISAGMPATFTLTAGGLNGFNSAITLSCSGEPAGTSCKFSPASLSPASGATATSMLTIATNSNPYKPYTVVKFASLFITVPVFTLMGLLLTGSGRRDDRSKRLARFASTLALIVAATGLLALAGCGGYGGGGGGSNGTPRGTTTVVITGTSGGAMHSASVSLTVQ
jgi:uncharacterized protein (TIGR03118 family)